MKKVLSNLGFWIVLVLLLIIVGNVIIYFSVLLPTEKFSNHISLTGSLLGGLITLVSVFVTNGYYNREKSNRDKLDKFEKIKFQLNALRFLKEEFEVNKNKLSEYKQKLNTKGGQTNLSVETFQTIIWENSKRDCVEIFIDISEKGLFDIQKFYILAKEYNGIIQPIQVMNDYLFKLVQPIELVIDNAINEYEQKLLEFDDIFQRVLKVTNYIREEKANIERINKIFGYK